MAQLSDTMVTGKLAVTGRIYEKGQYIDEKFITNVGWNASTKTISFLNGSNDAISSITLPSGSVKVPATPINALTFGSSASGTAPNATYAVTGEATVYPQVTTAGWVTSSNIQSGKISVSGTVKQSVVQYYAENTENLQTSAGGTIENVNAGSDITITAGYYPTNRTIKVPKADTSGESTSGTATSGIDFLTDLTTLPSFSSTSISGGYVVKLQPFYNVTGAGWLGTGKVSGSTNTYYVKKGSVSSSVSGTSPKFTISKTGTFIDKSTTYGITSGTAPSGTNGTNYLTLSVDGSSNTETFKANMTFTDGYIASKGTEGTVSVSATKAGNATYYVPIVTPAFDGGDVHSSISSWSGSSNITLDASNSASGISVKATPQSSRDAVQYNGAKKGLINIADNTVASAAVGNTSGTANTQYITAIAIGSGKTLGTVTMAGGTLTNLALSANSTITNLKSSDSTARTLTLGSISNIMTLDISKNNGGTIKIVNGENGQLLFKDYTASQEANSSYVTLTTGGGDLKRSNLSTYTASGSAAFANNLTIAGSESLNTDELSYSNSVNATDYYISIGADAASYNNLVVKNSTAISEGWLNAIGANQTIGTYNLTVNALTGKYIKLTPAVVTPSVVNLQKDSTTTVATTSTNTGYKFVATAKAKYTVGTSGWIDNTKTATTASASSLTTYIRAGVLSLSNSAVTAAPTISLAMGMTDGYNMTTTQPSNASTNYITVTGTTSNTSGTVNAKVNVSTDGYVTSSNNNANTNVTVTAGGDSSTTKTVWIPKVTPSFDGGTLTKATASGGVLSGGAPSVTGQSLTGSSCTLSDTNNGIAVTLKAKATRAAISVTEFNQTVNRAAVLYNGAAKGAINIADNTQALASGSTTVTLAAQSSAAATSGETVITKYISDVSIPSGKTFNVKSNSGTCKYETNWVISKDSSNNITFSYSA